MRAARAASLAAALVVLAPPSARGEGAGQAPPGAPGVQLRDVDRATVRVLAVTGVDLQPLYGKRTGQRRFVAILAAGHGSGVVIRADGLLLTARHVVEGASFLAGLLPGEDWARALRVVHVDPAHDLAFLAMEGTFEAIVPLASEPPSLHVTQRVTSSGYPLDPEQRFPAVASGEISRVTNDGRYQLAMSLNPGNSGGPVVDDAGRLLGIVSQGADPRQGAQGIVLAVPHRAILDAYTQHVEGKPLSVPTQAEAELEREVASLLTEMLRAGPFGLGFDERMSARLAALSRRTARPDVLTFAAAHAWNRLISLLEAHGAPSMDHLPASLAPGAQHLWDTMVSLCRRAAASDARARARFPFLDAVLRASDAVAADHAASCGYLGGACCPDFVCLNGGECLVGRCAAPSTCGAFAGCAPGWTCAAGRCLPRSRGSTGHVAVHAGPELDQFLSVRRGAATVTVSGSLAVWRTPPGSVPELRALVGLGGTVASSKDGLRGGGSLEGGVQVRLGDSFGPSVAAHYTPGVLAGAGGASVALAAFRARAGLHVRPFEFGAAWQESYAPDEHTLRVLGIFLGADF